MGLTKEYDLLFSQPLIILSAGNRIIPVHAVRCAQIKKQKRPGLSCFKNDKYNAF